MTDITFDDLINAKTAEQPTETTISTDNLMQYGQLALSILQQFNIAKGGSVVETRPQAQQTETQMEAVKPMVDIDQVKNALTTIQSLKGDINISSMLKLLEENKEAVAEMLKGL